MELIQPQIGAGRNKYGKPLSCGLRLSVFDVFILFITIPLTWLAWFVVGESALVFPFVIVHFFLFCNVFRIRRRSELIWAGTFLLNAAGHIFWGQLWLVSLFSSQLLITLLLVRREVQRSDYHGICSNRWNPNIDAYLAGDLFRQDSR